MRIDKDRMVNFLDILKNSNIYFDYDKIKKRCLEIVAAIDKKFYDAKDETYPAIVYVADNTICALYKLAMILYKKEREYSSYTIKISRETRNIVQSLGEENAFRRDFCQSPKMVRRVRYNTIVELWKSGKIMDNFCAYVKQLPVILTEYQISKCNEILNYFREHTIKKEVALFPIIVYFVTASEIGYVQHAVYGGEVKRYVIGCTRNDIIDIPDLLRRGHLLGYDIKLENIKSYARIAKILVDLINRRIIDLPHIKIVRRKYYGTYAGLWNGTSTLYENA